MSSLDSTNRWCKLVTGIGMLGVAIFGVFICLGNKIGFGRALASIVLGGFAALWIIVGVVLIVSGLSEK